METPACLFFVRPILMTIHHQCKAEDKPAEKRRGFSGPPVKYLACFSRRVEALAAFLGRHSECVVTPLHEPIQSSTQAVRHKHMSCLRRRRALRFTGPIEILMTQNKPDVKIR